MKAKYVYNGSAPYAERALDAVVKVVTDVTLGGLPARFVVVGPTLLKLSASDFPTRAMQYSFLGIVDDLTWKIPAAGLSCIAASTVRNELMPGDNEAIADRIVKLHRDLATFLNPNRELQK